MTIPWQRNQNSLTFLLSVFFNKLNSVSLQKSLLVLEGGFLPPPNWQIDLSPFRAIQVVLPLSLLHLNLAICICRRAAIWPKFSSYFPPSFATPFVYKQMAKYN